MNTIKDLDRRIKYNKVKIVTFLINIFLVMNSLVIFFYASIVFYDYKLLLQRNIPIYMSVSLLTFVLFFFLKKKLSLKSIKFTLYLIVFFLTLIALFLFLFSGTGVVVSTLLIFVMVSVISIIDTVSASRAYVFTVIGMYILIFVAHNFLGFEYVPDSTASYFSGSFIFILMLMCFGYIGKIGYSEIENSYAEAAGYAKKLEKLNQELDSRVQDRTKRLTENFNRNSETLYKAALVGGITRPLLHDIATPISTLKGGIELLKNERFKDKEILEIITESTNQIDAILTDSRELIRGNDVTSVFSVNKTIKKIIKIISSELKRNDIKIEFMYSGDFHLKATQSLFERCILNLLLNSLEELVHKEDKRKILVLVYEESGKGFIEVVDNGRGIPPHVINNIFSENFSLKNTTDNLGLGLPFVKNTIENKLHGAIKVESIINQFTKFIITLDVFTEQPTVQNK